MRMWVGARLEIFMLVVQVHVGSQTSPVISVQLLCHYNARYSMNMTPYLDFHFICLQFCSNWCRRSPPSVLKVLRSRARPKAAWNTRSQNHEKTINSWGNSETTRKTNLQWINSTHSPLTFAVHLSFLSKAYLNDTVFSEIIKAMLSPTLLKKLTSSCEQQVSQNWSILVQQQLI